MTKLLEKAFAEISGLPDDDQDRYATLLLAELESERKWSEAFASSADQLGILAEEALKEYNEGKTTPLRSDDL